MKKIVGLLPVLLLISCAQKAEQANIQMDLQTLEQYNQRVKSGDTVFVTEKQDYSKAIDYPLNASDNRPKVEYRPVYQQSPVMFIPSVSYHYSYWR